LTVILVPISFGILKTIIFGQNNIDLSNKNCEC